MKDFCEKATFIITITKKNNNIKPFYSKCY